MWNHRSGTRSLYKQPRVPQSVRVLATQYDWFEGPLSSTSQLKIRKWYARTTDLVTNHLREGISFKSTFDFCWSSNNHRHFSPLPLTRTTRVPPTWGWSSEGSPPEHSTSGGLGRKETGPEGPEVYVKLGSNYRYYFRSRRKLQTDPELI